MVVGLGVSSHEPLWVRAVVHSLILCLDGPVWRDGSSPLSLALRSSFFAVFTADSVVPGAVGPVFDIPYFCKVATVTATVSVPCLAKWLFNYFLTLIDDLVSRRWSIPQ